MLNRKKRKGFWWYSWILILLAIGGVVGGYYYGNQEWEKGAKEYRAKAIVQADIRKRFLQGKAIAGVESSTDPNRSEAKKILQGVGTLRPVMQVLNLTNRWTLSDAEALKRLSGGVDVQISDKDEVVIRVTSSAPKEAAEIANAVAAQATESLNVLDEKKKTEALNLLEAEIAEARKPVILALEVVKIALDSNGLPIIPTEDTDLRPYLEIEDVLTASVDLDLAKENLKQIQKEQTRERLHWSAKMRAPQVVQEAVPPASFSGPDKAPIQKKFALYGLSAGLLLGLTLMFLLWKLFTPKMG